MDSELRQHCMVWHDLRPDSALSGGRLEAWHESDHVVINDHALTDLDQGGKRLGGHVHL